MNSNNVSPSLFYKIDFDNGESCKAVRVQLESKRDLPDTDQLIISIVHNEGYEYIKKLVANPITSIRVTTCRMVAPAEYIQVPDIIEETVYDRYGAEISIEPYYTYGHTLRLFKISDTLEKIKEYEDAAMQTAITIIDMYETVTS